jgi:glycosyltransferase involved in cell wall biosynthesis
MKKNKMMFISFLHPSLLGSGSQIRAATLIQMLSKKHPVYLFVIHQQGTQTSAILDEGMNDVCQKIVYVNLDGAVAQEKAPLCVPCRSTEIGQCIRDFYDKHQLDSIFLFKIETYCLINIDLSLYPVKYIDLDELASKRNQGIEHLKKESGVHARDPVTQRGHTLLKMIERKIIPQFNHIFVASDLEATEVRQLIGGVNVHVLPNTLPSPTFESKKILAHPQEILFVGSLFYYPNEDAVHYFSNEIFPLIDEALKGQVKFRIIGFSAPKSLNELKKRTGIDVLGYQKNLTSFYSRASLVVVPLRTGSGTRIKIIEAFIHNCPVVSTSIGAMGLGLCHQKNILLADDPHAFAQTCVNVLTNPHLSSRLIDGGKKHYQEHHSPEVLASFYEKAVTPLSL